MFTNDKILLQESSLVRCTLNAALASSMHLVYITLRKRVRLHLHERVSGEVDSFLTACVFPVWQIHVWRSGKHVSLQPWAPDATTSHD